MSLVIGKFEATPKGGFKGQIRTLDFSGSVSLHVNPEKTGENDPDLLAYSHDIPLGKAYKRTSQEGNDYHRVLLSFPSGGKKIVIEGNLVPRNGKFELFYD